MSQLISHLIRSGVLTTPYIIEAFQRIDRADFVLPAYRLQAYMDQALSIGYGQTISQPTTVAIMLELLQPQKGDKILDVGAGSGRTTALLAYIVGTEGKVIGVERVPELVEFGQYNLSQYHLPEAQIVQAQDSLGWPDESPYDRILVSAAGQAVPRAFIEQLKIDGTLVLPVLHALWKVHRVSETENKIEKLEGFTFVPLIGMKH